MTFALADSIPVHGWAVQRCLLLAPNAPGGNGFAGAELLVVVAPVAVPGAVSLLGDTATLETRGAVVRHRAPSLSCASQSHVNPPQRDRLRNGTGTRQVARWFSHPTPANVAALLRTSYAPAVPIARLIYVSVAPEQAAEAERVWKEECAQLMIKQPGCLSEELLKCLDAPGEYISYSEWESDEAIERYRASAAHEEIRRHTRGLRGGSAPVVKRYIVAG